MNININKITVVASTVKVVKDGQEKVIKDGKYIVGFFDTDDKFWTGAEYCKAENDADLAKLIGKDWARREYAVHAAHEFAIANKSVTMTNAVTRNLEADEAAWHSAEDKRKADAEYRKTHKDETAFKRLAKAADSAKKTAGSGSVKHYCETISKKCNKSIDLMNSYEVNSMDELDAILKKAEELEKEAA